MAYRYTNEEIAALNAENDRMRTELRTIAGVRRMDEREADQIVTPRPWQVVDYSGNGKGWIEIRGPNDEAVATIFPFAARGGVGIDAARHNAILITILANAEGGIR